jgi:DNA repair protein SbcC/Rad50
MRPLTLRMSGLRSYRSEVTIDFGDPGLIAVVGDTGAGKSSILEALFFVLYGGCTWDFRATAPLISDGVTVMQVELVFLAEGRRWRVFRSASRTAPQSRHELECLDAPAIRFDNDGPVTDEIKRLIGLDQRAFLRTVMLPQGQFQLLLQATRADRTAILKGIFRLDQLAQAREQADRAARRLRPAVADLRAERAALLPDPEAALVDARQRHEQARARQGELQGLSETITAKARQRDEADRRVGELRERERRVRDTAVPDAGAQLEELAGIASQLEEQRSQLEADREQQRRHASFLAGLLTRADEQGEGIEALASAVSTVQFLAEQIPGIHAEEAACEREARDLEALAASIIAGEDGAASLKVQASAARAAEARLADAATAASKLLTEARTRLTSVRNSAATHSERQEEAEEAAERKSEAAGAIEPAAARASAAGDEREAARAALEAIQRANAAAHAAEGCQPGDPCPICQRPLPAGFTPQPPPGEADARAKLTTAERAAQQTASELARREADLTNASEALDRAVQAARESQTAFGETLAALRQVLPDVNLGASDEELLASLAASSASATAAHQAQAAEANQLAQDAERAAGTAEALRAQMQQRSGQLHTRQEAARQRKASSEKAASELPAGYRPDIPLTADRLAETLKRVESKRSELAKLSEQLADAHAVIDRMSRDLDSLNAHFRAHVDEPARQLAIKLSIAEQRFADLAIPLRAALVPARTGEGLADDAAWAHELKIATDAILAQVQEAITNLQQQHADAVGVISNALAAARVDDERGLQQAIVDASADLRRADDDIQTAAEQIPRVAELASKIAQVQGLLEAVDELARLLSDAKFIAYVVARKQQTLLAVATELLGSMTGSRYGFSEQFEIVDRLTSLPRSAKTLSGGETFLASLALALGLVELAGRGGGRLDALFLDEGFGALDANSLSEALDALGRQAESGRLVAVISHLRSVAEAMDRVLAVTFGPSGSQVRWLGGDQRDELIAEDVEASLLT